MSPERANVFIAEDQKDFVFMLEEFAKLSGHTVVAKADNLSDALDCVDKFGELNVDVAYIDGNLSRGDSSGNDGQIILRDIQEKYPNVKTIGMSANRFPGVDIDLGKENLSSVGEVTRNL